MSVADDSAISCAGSREVGRPPRQIAGSPQWNRDGRRDPSRIFPSAPDEGQHILVDHIGMGRGHAVRITFISLQRPLREQLRRERGGRSEEHTSELQSLMRISYAVFCLKKKILY